jgi:acyl-CoA thioesterase-1
MSKDSENLSINRTKIMITGDSISKGVIYDESRSKYVLLEDNYVSLMQKKLKGVVRNTARFGNTLIKGMGNLKKDILKEKPDFVLIEYGGNDCDFHWNQIADNPGAEHNPKTDFNVFESMLRETIELLKSQHITPILMNLPPLNAENYFKWVSQNNPVAASNILKWLGSVTKIYWWQERYNSTIVKVAESTKTRIIDVRSAFLEQPDFTKFICVDGIHPNKDGHRLIFNKVLDYIQINDFQLLLDNKN